MIITDKFVMINFPKTGSTFARHIIEKLYDSAQIITDCDILDDLVYKKLTGPFLISFMLPEIEFGKSNPLDKNQHGKFEQVPENFKHLKVLSILRSPYERYVSAYEYGFWKSYLFDDLEVIMSKVPKYPDLDFKGYLNYQDLQATYRYGKDSCSVDIGNQTAQFIQYFFKSPREAFSKLCDDYIYSKKYLDDMPNIRFIKSENLNLELYNFLLDMGYEKNKINFILNQDRIRPQDTERLTDQERLQYYTKEYIDYVTYKERYLLKIYSDFGAVYDPYIQSTFNGEVS